MKSFNVDMYATASIFDMMFSKVYKEEALLQAYKDGVKQADLTIDLLKKEIEQQKTLYSNLKAQLDELQEEINIMKMSEAEVEKQIMSALLHGATYRDVISKFEVSQYKVKQIKKKMKSMGE